MISLVRTITEDRVELQGLLYEAKNSDKIIIHLHGTWGNFYGNPFIDYFGSSYPLSGYSFLSVNTRGHDEGSISERFEDCQRDINIWLAFVQKNGYKSIILQGHSLGALKVVYYVGKQGAFPIDRLILLSPFDGISFYCRGKVETRSDLIRRISEIPPDQIVPKEIWGMWLISGGTLLDLVGFDTTADIFPFRNHTLQNTPLARIKQPVFAAVGGKDFAAFPNPNDEYNQLSKLENVHTVLIPDAPHNFAGGETQLVRSIMDWLKG